MYDFRSPCENPPEDPEEVFFSDDPKIRAELAQKHFAYKHALLEGDETLVEKIIQEAINIRKKRATQAGKAEPET